MTNGCQPSLVIFVLNCLCIVEAMVKMIQAFMEITEGANGIGYLGNVTEAERRRLAREVVFLIDYHY